MEEVVRILSAAVGEPITKEFLFHNNRYYSDDLVREWLGYMLLRRHGHVPALSAGMAHMEIIKDFAIDRTRANALFAEARKTDARLDAFLSARYTPKYHEIDFGAYAPGSFGAILYNNIVGQDLDLNLAQGKPFETDFEYFMFWGLSSHDIEHVLGGAQVNEIGELIPHMMRYGFLFQYLPAELAGMLSTPLYLVTMSHLVSAMIHTPDIFPTVMDTIARGWRIGRESGPYLYARFEDYFPLPITEARRALGIRNVEEVDTSQASASLLAQNLAA
jgi:ubiquinone biosynthesis protein Coq4